MLFGKTTLGMRALLPFGLALHVGYVGSTTVAYIVVFWRKLGPGSAFFTATGLWIFSGLVFAPVVGWGFFALGLGGKAALNLLAVHFVYGLLLWAGSWLAFRQARSRPTPRMAMDFTQEWRFDERARAARSHGHAGVGGYGGRSGRAGVVLSASRRSTDPSVKVGHKGRQVKGQSKDDKCQRDVNRQQAGMGSGCAQVADLGADADLDHHRNQQRTRLGYHRSPARFASPGHHRRHYPDQREKPDQVGDAHVGVYPATAVLLTDEHPAGHRLNQDAKGNQACDSGDRLDRVRTRRFEGTRCAGGHGYSW